MSVPVPSRFDPYYQGAWSAAAGGSAVAWGGRQWQRRLAASGDRAAIEAVAAEEAAALTAALSPIRRRKSLAVLAVLQSWGIATVEQVAAISGIGSAAGRRGPLPWLVDAGLVQLGRIIPATGHSYGPRLLRLERNGPFELLDELITWREWMAHSGGEPWGRSLPGDRHTLLSVEWSLRAAETSPLVVVAGERQASLTDLLASPAGARRRADALWVRSDGLRIAVEMTAAIDRSIETKARAWVDALAADKSRSVAVLFVGAFSPTDDRRRSGYALMTKAIARACSSSLEAATAQVDRRVAWTTWEDWYPAPGEAAGATRTLRAEMPIGEGSRRFVPVDLADPFAVPAGAPPPGVVERYRRLAGIPVWQQRRSDDDHLDELVALAGLQGPYRTLAARPWVPASARRRAGGADRLHVDTPG